jgi:signal transduction histidine kinase/ActR/RegA family two-component response regulator
MMGSSAYAYAAAIAVVSLVAILCALLYRSERARRLSEARLLRTIRATGVGPWERDVTTGKYWLASEWLELLGYAPGELPATAQALGSILHPDDIATQRAALKRCIEEGQPYDVEFRARTRGGDYPWFHSRGLPEFDASGRVVRIAGALENVTERHLSRAALIEAQRVAAQASRAKGDFLAEMSHEIRTPMNGVLGMAELLLGTRLDPEQRDCVQTIQVSANALLMLVNDVLDLSKIEAGKLELLAKPTDLREVVADVARLMSTQALAKGLDLTTHVDPTLPAQVLGDALRIRQIFINLAGNAIKFTERGEVAVVVKCTGSDRSRISVRCEVRDTGPGMTPTQLEKLFRAYSQVETAEPRKEAGTGLGLSIVRRLATLMGGEAGVVSRQGAGSTFWFTATFSTVEDAAAEPAASAVDRQNFRSVDASKCRVLVADDNVVNQKVACMMLRRLGAEVTLVSNGVEAVEAWKNGGFDLILMDCQMPKLDGLGATRSIREQELPGQRTPIVALTANAMKGEEAHCLDAGMDGYLTKPITLDTLRTCLAKWRGEVDEPMAIAMSESGLRHTR